MSEKQTNFFKELGDVLKLIGVFVAGIITGMWNTVRSWQWTTIRRVLGVGITFVGLIILVVDLVVGVLLLTGPNQVAAIMQSWCGVNLFDHITLPVYVGFIAGGLVMDVVFATVLMWWGIYWWYGKNYFNTPRYAVWYAGALFVVGFALFSTAVFYSLPELARMHADKHEQYKHMYHMHQMHKQEPMRYQYYYPSRNDFYRQQREIEEFHQQLQRELDRMWYR